MEQVSKETYIRKIEQLEKIILERNQSLKTSDARLVSLNNKFAVIERENKYLKEDLRKRENYLQQKLQLEIRVKEVDRQNKELVGKMMKLQEKVHNADQELSKKEDKIKQSSDVIKEIHVHNQELSTKYKALKNQEELLRRDISSKSLELKEKTDHITKRDEEYTILHQKLIAMSKKNSETAPSPKLAKVKFNNLFKANLSAIVRRS